MFFKYFLYVVFWLFKLFVEIIGQFVKLVKWLVFEVREFFLCFNYQIVFKLVLVVEEEVKLKDSLVEFMVQVIEDLSINDVKLLIEFVDKEMIDVFKILFDIKCFVFENLDGVVYFLFCEFFNY